MHRKRVRRIWGGFFKSQFSWVLRSEEEEWLSVARNGLVAGATCVGWGRWKSQNRKNVYLSPYVEEPLNSKVIKSFVPELRSRYVFFVFRDSYVLCIYVMNILCTFHISISGYATNWSTYIIKEYGNLNTKKRVKSLCKKKKKNIGSRISNICICIFAFIDPSVFTRLFFKFLDISQTTIFDLTWKIWRNIFRNLFLSKISKIQFLSQLDSKKNHYLFSDNFEPT